MRIIKNQPTLQLVGVYHNYIPNDLVNPVIELQESNVPIPTIFGLGREGGVLYWNTFTIFPELSVDSESGGLIDRLLESFSKHRTYRCPIARRKDHAEFYIFLSDLSDLPAIAKLLETISKRSPNIYHLEICLRNECEIVSFIFSLDLSTYSLMYFPL